MNNLITSIVLGLSILAQVYLELKGIKVPTIIYLLSGFAVRHIIGDNSDNGSTGNVGQIKAIPEASNQQKVL